MMNRLRILSLIPALLLFAPLWSQEATQADAESATQPTEESIQQPLDPGTPTDTLGVDDLAVDRFEAATLYRQYMENDDYQQALEAAEVGLQLSEHEFGPTHIGVVSALNDMGEALLFNNQPEEAQHHFTRSIMIVRSQRGIYSPELYEPLVGLGRAEQAIGKHEEATLNFLRAQHITHRTEGVYNLAQVEVLDEMVESLMAQDKWEEAENLQLTVYKIYRNNYGSGTIDSLPAVYKLARWYHSIQDYRQARLLLRRAIATVEDEHGPASPELISPLRGMASAYLEERGINLDKGLAAHQRIAQIVDNDDSVDDATRIQAHLELGDWHVLLNQDQAAWAEYRQAWELAQAADQQGRDWNEYLGRPHLIYPGGNLSVDFIGLGRVGDEVYYDFEFIIDRTGRPDGINVIGTNLHGQTRAAAIQAFRYARFRPAIVDGVAMTTPGYRVRRVYPTPPPEDYGSVGFGNRSGAGSPRGR